MIRHSPLDTRQARATLTTRSARAPRRRAPITLALATVAVAMLAVVASVVAGQALAPASAAIPSGSPAGHLDSLVAAPGGVAVKGWALDPSTKNPIAIRVTRDGATVLTFAAKAPRADIGRAYPHYGAAHGFSTRVLLIDGTHRICVVAMNVAAGANRTLGCARIKTANNPGGHVDAVTADAGKLNVSGWAFDPNAPTAPITVTVTVDSAATSFPAMNPRPDVARSQPAIGAAHGFAASIPLPQGTHAVCVTANNVGYGANATLRCATVTLNESPSASLDSIAQTPGGLTVQGWAFDPDAPAAALSVAVEIDGAATTLTAANARADLARAYPTAGPNHGFAASYSLAQGSHTVCVTVRNVSYGADLAFPCRTVVLNFNPYGRMGVITRAAGSTNLVVTGWAIDPDTTDPISVSATLDGHGVGTVVAGVFRPDVARVYPGTGTSHGYSMTLPADTNEHTVCVTALNVAGGTGNTPLGCKIVNAVHPVVPSAPTGVIATAGFGGATITWQAPTSDGGAPWAAYTITASPGGASVTVGGALTTATVMGLKPSTGYTFAVVAMNVAGPSAAGVSAGVLTQASPPPQTTPAPISTSRYIRNIRNASAAEQAMMRAEGAADARANPSGHGYLVLLDIGGQDEAAHGVVLSAGVRFVSYANLVTDLDAYVDGYRSQQRPSAPVVIALGTNNDMDVSLASGGTWARTIVNPVLAHAANYIGMTIAGADDIEPGFNASYPQTASWLTGYLAATRAPFVFNGSADGCAATITNGRCNNGWTAGGLYQLSGGKAPTRIISLPQIYNNTMAAQWKFISLTGVSARQPRINFGGALTEWTACTQARSCGSLTGNLAWGQMWGQLRSNAALMPPSLPYSTDLRIDS